jgi:hypothetical protein
MPLGMSQTELKLNGTEQLLFYAETAYWVRESMNIVKKSSVLLVSGKKVGLEVNVENMKYVCPCLVWV